MGHRDRRSTSLPAGEWLFWGLYVVAVALLAWSYATPDRSALHELNRRWWHDLTVHFQNR